MGRKFGWHSGNLTVNSILANGLDNQPETSYLFYSGGKVPAASRVDLNTYSNSQFVGQQIWVTSNSEITEDSSSKGIAAFRASIDYTHATTGEDAAKAGTICGGLFIAKASNAAVALGYYHPLIGIEGWAYVSTTTGSAKTMLGGNFGYRVEDGSTANFPTGSVFRGVQIFCDLDDAGTAPVEQSALCLWNQSGTQDNAIRIVQSDGGFTNLLDFDTVAAPISVSSTGSLTKTHKIAINVAGDTRYIQVGTIS